MGWKLVPIINVQLLLLLCQFVISSTRSTVLQHLLELHWLHSALYCIK